MKKIVFSCLLILAMLITMSGNVLAAPAGSAVNAAQEQEASAAYGCNSLDGKVAIMGNQQIVPNMTAAFLFDVDMQVVLYALNPDMPIYPASLVKIMTALIAVEQGNVNDIVTVKDSVISTVPGSAVTVRLQPNENISLSDLLYCMMVGSANDAAAVIADYGSGSQEAFVVEMNKKAAELGCTGTVFTNPHGLVEAQQVSTARDIAKILNYAIKNQDFMTYFSEEYYVVPQTNKFESRELYSNNYLMYSPDNMRIYRDYRTTGGRTGLDEYERRCVAATAVDNGRTLISVIFGAESEYDEENKKTITFGGFKETSDLFTLGFEEYAPAQVLYEGQIFRQYAVDGGENDVVVGSFESAYSVLPVDAASANLSFRFFDEEKAFSAPIEKGQKLSHVQIWYGNVCVAQTDLYAMSEVRQLVTAAEEKVPGASGGVWKDVLITVAAIVICMILILLALRLVGILRVAAIKRRSKRYRRSRRRSR